MEELDAREDQVKVEVIEEPVKGLFGFIGSKDAVIRVTKEDSYPEKAKAFLSEVIEKMDVRARVEMEETEDALHLEIVDVEERNAGIIIGKRGETLDALVFDQYC